ncbi:MAG: hypothetical protein ACE5DU_07250 [Nitrosopumilus sp.]
MAKSLGEYTLSKTSSVASEIQWSKKNPADPDKPKKKKKKNTTPTNIISSGKIMEPVEKTFKVDEKPKKKKSGKKFEKSTLTSDKIERGYRRPGR